MPRRKRTKPELRVVFDTSSLFTQVANELVRPEIRQLITRNSSHQDLSIRWYLPNIVVEERRYQMQAKAFEFLPAIAKLEKLLGHNLNITEDILKDRVDKAIDNQLDELCIQTLDIEASIVDWNAMIHRAVHRHPPFQPGEKEKGFRDSLIAETFLQLVGQSPATPSVCRVATIINDALLREHVANITKNAKNVRVLAEINELEGLINTLVSEVTEEFVSDLKEKVGKFFFDEETRSGLYYNERIQDKITKSFSEELNKVQDAGLLRENVTWWIRAPVFIKKKGQRTFWMTLLTVEAKLFKYQFPEPKQLDPLASLGIPSGWGTYGSNPYSAGIMPEKHGVSTGLPRLGGLHDSLVAQKQYAQSGWSKYKDLVYPVPEKQEVASGESKFEVHWSVNITQNKKLTSAHVEKIEFMGTTWD